MTRADLWADVRDLAITRFELLDDGTGNAMAYSYYLRGVARQAGWADPRIPTTLAKVYSLRKGPTIGWGLNGSFTGPGGVLNPATTEYTVTDTDHVGMMLVEVYRQQLAPGGVDLGVPKADLQTLVNRVMGMQRFTFSSGVAVSYSDQPADNISASNGRNVHNANAGVAAFLQAAQDVGCSKNGLNGLINDIERFETAAWYAGGARWWPYKGTGSAADTDHSAYQAESFYGWRADRTSGIGHAIGGEMAYQIMHVDPDGGVGGVHDDEPNARIGWARLAGLPPGIGRVVGTTTQWLVFGDAYIDTITDFVATADLGRCGQIACWAARAADQAGVVL